MARALDAIVPPGPAAEGAAAARLRLYRPGFAGQASTLKDVRRRMREVARGEGGSFSWAGGIERIRQDAS
ncbi:MAG: hypothetical protein U0166_16085 [Acidobacteriota bacterium]